MMSCGCYIEESEQRVEDYRRKLIATSLPIFRELLRDEQRWLKYVREIHLEVCCGQHWRILAKL